MLICICFYDSFEIIDWSEKRAQPVLRKGKIAANLQINDSYLLIVISGLFQ